MPRDFGALTHRQHELLRGAPGRAAVHLPTDQADGAALLMAIDGLVALGLMTSTTAHAEGVYVVEYAVPADVQAEYAAHLQSPDEGHPTGWSETRPMEP